MVTFTLFGIGTDEDVTQTYYAYVRRDADGLYYDEDDSTFKAYGSLVDGQVDLAEDPDQPGCWSVTLDLSAHPDGVYTFIPRDGLTDFLEGDWVAAYYLVSGNPLPDQARAQVALHTDYGGIDQLRLEDENGEPVEGATIRVFTKLEFDTNGLDNPIGVTATNANGRWVNPVFVNSGDTYVVHYQDDAQIGPVSVEVMVP